MIIIKIIIYISVITSFRVLSFTQGNFRKNLKPLLEMGGVPLVNVHFKILLRVGEGNLV